MSNRAYASEYGGVVFLAVRTSGAWVDTEDEGEDTVYMPAYLLRRFDTDWSPEGVLIMDGEMTIPEYDWFYGVEFFD